MARCNGCVHDNVCNRDIGHGYSVCPHYVSAADVAPKSEVERLTDILNSYALQYGTVRDQSAVIEKAKSEVAREIFEEIEKHLFVITPIEEFDGWARMMPCDFERLKKKYTEGKT